METNQALHISVVLDRSGSMAAIADDIVGGFNEFLARQRAEAGEARITVAQFDSEDPFEVLIDGIPVREVTDLPREAYQPRGSTPLFDAIGSMIGRVDAVSAGRDEDQLMVIVTDGLENASREHDRGSVFSMITDHRRRGWSFMFLGADQDSYASGEGMALPRANTANWHKDREGTRKMWTDVSYSTELQRRRTREERRRRADSVYEEDPDGS
ncbi:MAG TPA: vWA domain-containing protein [Acidimicrobiia bacterium]|nr:vWA domain-containing protein [Acidimicrobiia bacterium]